MTHFNKFYADLRTIDYGLFWHDLYYLAELPIITDQPFIEPKEPISRKGQEELCRVFGLIKDEETKEHIYLKRQPTVEEELQVLKEIAALPVSSTDLSFHAVPHEKKIELNNAEYDWGNAVWKKYTETIYGADWPEVFDNKWADQEPGWVLFEEPLSDFLNLPSDLRNAQLNRLIDLAAALASSPDLFQERVNKGRTLGGWAPLWLTLAPFDWLHRVLSQSFLSINLPPCDDAAKLYFGVKYLERYERLIYKKVELIGFFVSEVQKLFNSTLQGSSTDDTWFNIIPISTEFKKVFADELSARACLRLMHSFALIGQDGQHKIGDRAKWHLLAFTEALQCKRLITNALPTKRITRNLAKQIGLKYAQPRKDNGVNENEYNSQMNIYISGLNSISTGELTWTVIADKCR